MNARRISLRWIISALALVLIAAVPAAAQQPPVSAPPQVSDVPLPVVLEWELIDSTGLLEASPQHGSGDMPDPAAFVLAGAEVEFRSFNPDAEEEITRGRTDAAGRVTLDLGQRYLGSPGSLRATLPDGRVYLAREEPIQNGSARKNLFRATDDHSALLQEVTRVVTVAPNQDDGSGETMVQVRQIIRYMNRSFEVFDGPPAAPGVGFLFPVPEGVEMLELSIAGEAALDLEARSIDHWGHGVPISEPVFPLVMGQLMGVYQFPVERGKIFDAGLEAIVNTASLVVSLEAGEFTHDEAVAAKMDVAPLTLSGAPAADVDRQMTSYTRNTIPAHEIVKVPVKYGPPPVPTDKILWMLLIVACFVVPVIGGIQIAKRGGVGPKDPAVREARLRQLHADGELSAADLERELAKMGVDAPAATSSPASSPAAARKAPAASAPPASVPAPTAPAPSAEDAAVLAVVLRSLESIADRAEESPESIAEDVRALARIVRGHVGDSAESAGGSGR